MDTQSAVAVRAPLLPWRPRRVVAGAARTPRSLRRAVVAVAEAMLRWLQRRAVVAAGTTRRAGITAGTTREATP